MITDNLQQMNKTFVPLAFRKLWGNVVKTSTAAILDEFHFHPMLSCYLLIYKAGS